MNKQTHLNSKQQRGSALMMSMLLLLVLTLLATMNSNTSVVQERMSGNFRDMTMAFEAAESGARWGESWLTSFTSLSAANIPCQTACSGYQPIWEYGQHPNDLASQDQAWWETYGRAYGKDPGSNVDLGMSVPAVKEQPRFVMEQMFFKQENLTEIPPTAIVYYRVTSRGMGARASSLAVVETTVARRITP